MNLRLGRALGKLAFTAIIKNSSTNGAQSAKEEGPHSGPTLVLRNVLVGTRRTSMRLEPVMWDALDEILMRQSISLNRLLEQIAEMNLAYSLSSSVRCFILSYFRTSSTEEGHAFAGHGIFRVRKPRGRPSKKAAKSK